MIRVLVVDDHPSVRVGLVHVLLGEPGLAPVGAAADADAAVEAARRLAADVALVDYDLGGSDDGLLLALRLRRLDPAPRVVIYSGYQEDTLAVGAHLAGVHAVLGKGAPVDRVFDTIKAAARGERHLPPAPAGRIEALRADAGGTADSLRELLRSLGPAVPQGGDDPAPAKPA